MEFSGSQYSIAKVDVGRKVSNLADIVNLLGKPDSR